LHENRKDAKSAKATREDQYPCLGALGVFAVHTSLKQEDQTRKHGLANGNRGGAGLASLLRGGVGVVSWRQTQLSESEALSSR